MMDRWLHNNAILRIVALVMSCILWLMVNAPNSGGTTPGTYEKQFPVPIHVQTSPGMVVSSMDNSTAVVIVSGQGLNLATLTAQMLGVTVVAKATGLTPGRHIVPLAAINMPNVPYTVDPSSVAVVLAQKVTVQKQVDVKIAGEPAAGFVAQSPAVDTPTVTVHGLQGAVSQVAEVQASLSIQGATKSVSGSVTLNAVNSAGKPVPGVTVDPAQVRVTVPVNVSKMDAVLQPQIVGTPAQGYAVAGFSVNPESVTLYGKTNGLSGPVNLNLPIDVTGLNASKVERVKVPLTPGVTNASPQKVSVSIDVQPAASKLFTQVPIRIKNIPPGGQVTLTGPSTVDLTVTGPKNIVDALTPSAISVYIDASGLKAADSAAPLTVSLPNWVEVSNISQQNVPVQVK